MSFSESSTATAVALDEHVPVDQESDHDNGNIVTDDICTAEQISLTKVRQYANGCSPISRLPVEVMVWIFTTVAAQETPWKAYYPSPFRYQKDFEKHGSLGWVRLSHVCMTWRAICLSTPDLWASQIGVLPRATPVFMERAGNRHLDVYMLLARNTPYHLFPQAAILSAIDAFTWPSDVKLPVSRIRSIICDKCFYGSYEKLLGLLSGQDMPRLELLRVNTLSLAEAHIDYHPSYRIEPVQFCAPVLKHIKMTNMFIPFTAASLTKLQLSFLDIPINFLIELSTKSPMLTHIEICRCSFSGLSTVDVEQDTFAHFKHAEAFSLLVRSDTNGAEQLLSALSFPSTTALTVTLDYFDESTFSSAARCVSQSCFSEDPPTSLVMESGAFVFYDAPLEPSSQETVMPPKSAQRASLSWNEPLVLLRNSHPLLSSDLLVHFSKIRSLRLDVDYLRDILVTAGQWANLFRRLPEVRNLRVGMHASFCVVRALACSRKLVGRANVSQTILPSLQTLWIDQFDNEDDCVPGLGVLEMTACTLISRAKVVKDSPRRLVFGSMAYPADKESIARRLHKLVPDICWSDAPIKQ